MPLDTDERARVITKNLDRAWLDARVCIIQANEARRRAQSAVRKAMDRLVSLDRVREHVVACKLPICMFCDELLANGFPDQGVSGGGAPGKEG